MSNLAIIFLKTVFEFCIGFFRIRTLKYCKYVIGATPDEAFGQSSFPKGKH